MLAGALTLPAVGQTRIGTIDLRKVFDNYWKRQQAEAALKERGTTMDKELKGFMAGLQQDEGRIHQTDDVRPGPKQDAG